VSEDDLARTAVIFSLNAHEGPGGVPALFEMGCKVSHACGSSANASSSSNEEERGGAGGRRRHFARAFIPAGALITTDYHFSAPEMALLSTRSRRTVIRRAKFFECLCARCSAPDPLMALPCPRCAPREPATGCLPDSAVFLPSGGLRGKEDGPQLALPVPLAVFEAEQKKEEGAGSGQRTDGDADPFVWRCGACHGNFTEADINAASPPVAAGVPAPVPATHDFAPLTKPTPIMEVEAWAERSSNEAYLNVVRGNARRIRLLLSCHASVGILLINSKENPSLARIEWVGCSSSRPGKPVA
jgi:cytochrome c553